MTTKKEHLPFQIDLKIAVLACICNLVLFALTISNYLAGQKTPLLLFIFLFLNIVAQTRLQQNQFPAVLTKTVLSLGFATTMAVGIWTHNLPPYLAPFALFILAYGLYIPYLYLKSRKGISHE